MNDPYECGSSYKYMNVFIDKSLVIISGGASNPSARVGGADQL